MSSRFLVVGCGSIGGVIAAHLAELDYDVTVLTTNTAIARAIAERGLRVRGEGAPEAGVQPRAVRESITEADGEFDFVLLSTQPPQVEAAARNAAPFLSATGRMVCFQNGLCEDRVAAIAGTERVVGAVVTWGASVVEPGVVDRTSSGGFTVGTLAGPRDACVDELARVLEAVGPVTLTDNLAGARWSKLAINCAISTLGTVGGDRLGVLMRQRHVRRLVLDVMTETVAVARAEEIRLEKVSGTLDLDWIALTESERQATGSPGLLAKHGLLLAVGARYRRLRSSMLAAIERGREPAVDFLNGEVVERARKRGMAVPVNEAARDAVWAIARGEARPSHEHLRALYDRTR